LAEQAVALFLDFGRTESGLRLPGDEEHDDDVGGAGGGKAELRRMQAMSELLAWVFAPRGTHACLSFLDDAPAAADGDDRDRLEDDEDKLALFSWLGPSLSRWIGMNRFRATSCDMVAACKHVALRLPQAWRMLRACMATTTTATTAGHHHRTKLTRAQLEHVTKVLIVCLRCFVRTYHPLRGTMRGLCDLIW
jgi:hypothetical protein